MLKMNVFMIMPFNEEFLALYESLKEKYEESFSFSHAGDLDCQQSIIKDIVIGIEQADLVIADLTNRNANVFYELGLAHAMSKKVILITQDVDDLPFDIKAYNANQYSNKFYKITELYQTLDKLFEMVRKGSVKFGNPVSDYAQNHWPLGLSEESPSANLVSVHNENAFEDEESPREFLDYFVDIEEAVTSINSETNSITSDMNAMTVEINHATEEVNRVKTSGGDSTAVFVRNVSRRLSFPISTFASQLKEHTSIIKTKWGIVETCYLSLLEDKRLEYQKNSESLKQSIAELIVVKNTIYIANQKIVGFIDVLNNSLGIERHLSKSIITLTSELDNYLSTAYMMAASIDRIKTKSDIMFSKTA